MDIHELVKQAIDKWVVLCGVTPGEDWKNLEQYQVTKTYDAINSSLDSDFSGLTSLLVIRQLFEKCLTHSTFSYREVLNDEHLGVRCLLRELQSILYGISAEQYVDQFTQELAGLVANYDLPEKAQELTKDPVAITELRKSAFEAGKQLEELRFLKGEPGGEIKFYRHVLEVWNTASLVRLAGNTTEDFIALVMVRDEKHLAESYFCVVCKHGQNVTIWTDRTEMAHPLESSMRRNSRATAERINKWWFPYEVLEIEITDKGRCARIPQRNGISPLQQEFIRHCEIKDLSPACALWVVLTFHVLVNKVKAEEYQTKALCYVADCVTVPAILAENNMLAVPGKYKPFELPEINSDHFQTKEFNSQFDRDYAGDDAWLIEKYGQGLTAADLVIVNGDKRLEQKAPKKTWSTDRVLAKVELAGLSQVAMGTQEQLAQDVEFLARYNQIEYVNQRAAKAFNKTAPAVCEWVRKRIAANRWKLILAGAVGTVFESGAWANESDKGLGFDTIRTVSDMARTIKYKTAWTYRLGRTAHWHGSDLTECKLFFVLSDCGIQSWEQYRGGNMTVCCVLDRRASIFCQLAPTTADGLAWLCGVTPDKLPAPLRHWNVTEEYTGNHLLDRVDPLHWHIKNPWRTFLPTVIVPFSVNGLKAMRGHVTGLAPKDMESISTLTY